MTDYISREAVREFFLNMDAGSSRFGSTLLTPEEFVEHFVECLDDIPAADVAPVVHGHWVCKALRAIRRHCRSVLKRTIPKTTP